MIFYGGDQSDRLSPAYCKASWTLAQARRCYTYCPVRLILHELVVASAGRHTDLHSESEPDRGRPLSPSSPPRRPRSPRRPVSSGYHMETSGARRPGCPFYGACARRVHYFQQRLSRFCPHSSVEVLEVPA